MVIMLVRPRRKSVTQTTKRAMLKGVIILCYTMMSVCLQIADVANCKDDGVDGDALLQSTTTSDGISSSSSIDSKSSCDLSAINKWFQSLAGSGSDPQVEASIRSPNSRISVGLSPTLGGLGILASKESTADVGLKTTTKTIQGGTKRGSPSSTSTMMAIPDSVVFSKETVTSTARPYGLLLHHASSLGLSQEAVIGLALLYEMALGARSPFSPWLRCLPPASSMTMPSMLHQQQHQEDHNNNNQNDFHFCLSPTNTEEEEEACRRSGAVIAVAFHSGPGGIGSSSSSPFSLEGTYFLRPLTTSPSLTNTTDTTTTTTASSSSGSMRPQQQQHYHLVPPFDSLLDEERNIRRTVLTQRRQQMLGGYVKAKAIRIKRTLIPPHCLFPPPPSSSSKTAKIKGEEEEAANANYNTITPPRRKAPATIPLLTALEMCASPSVAAATGGEEEATPPTTTSEGSASPFSRESYMYVQALLGSRAWYLRGVMVLAPIADMLNYAPLPPPLPQTPHLSGEKLSKTKMSMDPHSPTDTSSKTTTSTSTSSQQRRGGSGIISHQRRYNVITEKPSFTHRSTGFHDHHKKVTLSLSSSSSQQQQHARRPSGGESRASGGISLLPDDDDVYHPVPNIRAYTLPVFGKKSGRRGHNTNSNDNSIAKNGVVQYWEIASDRPFPPVGEELFEFYGDSPNLIYLMFHGFVPGDVVHHQIHSTSPNAVLSPSQNPHETVGVLLSVPAAKAIATSLLPRRADNYPEGASIPGLVLSALGFTNGELDFCGGDEEGGGGGLIRRKKTEQLLLYPLHATSVIQYSQAGHMSTAFEDESSTSTTTKVRDDQQRARSEIGLDPVLLAWALGPALAVMEPRVPSKAVPQIHHHHHDLIACFTDVRAKLTGRPPSHSLFEVLLRRIQAACFAATNHLWLAKLYEMQLRTIQRLLQQTFLGTFGVPLILPNRTTAPTAGERLSHQPIPIAERFRLFKKRILYEHYRLVNSKLSRLKSTVVRLKQWEQHTVSEVAAASGERSVDDGGRLGRELMGAGIVEDEL